MSCSSLSLPLADIDGASALTFNRASVSTKVKVRVKAPSGAMAEDVTREMFQTPRNNMGENTETDEQRKKRWRQQAVSQQSHASTCLRMRSIHSAQHTMRNQRVSFQHTLSSFSRYHVRARPRVF